MPGKLQRQWQQVRSAAVGESRQSQILCGFLCDMFPASGTFGSTVADGFSASSGVGAVSIAVLPKSPRQDSQADGLPATSQAVA